GHLVGRRNRPPPGAGLAIASPSGPCHRATCTAYCCLPASISHGVYCWASKVPAEIRIKKQIRNDHIPQRLPGIRNAADVTSATLARSFGPTRNHKDTTTQRQKETPQSNNLNQRPY